MDSIKIYTKRALFNIAPNFCGPFFKDTNHSEDGGFYPKMLRNRAFEDPVLPKRCEPFRRTYEFVAPERWRNQFNNGEDLERWLERTEKTPVPA